MKIPNLTLFLCDQCYPKVDFTLPFIFVKVGDTCTDKIQLSANLSSARSRLPPSHVLLPPCCDDVPELQVVMEHGVVGRRHDHGGAAAARYGAHVPALRRLVCRSPVVLLRRRRVMPSRSRTSPLGVAHLIS